MEVILRGLTARQTEKVVKALNQVNHKNVDRRIEIKYEPCLEPRPTRAIQFREKGFSQDIPGRVNYWLTFSQYQIECL